MVTVAPWPKASVAAAATPAFALATGPPLAAAFVAFAFDPRPSALGRIPALADRLQADLALRVDLLHFHGQLVADLHGFLDR
jgi:hypothetical protein